MVVAFVHAVYILAPDTTIGAKSTGTQQLSSLWGLADYNMEGEIAMDNIEIRVIEIIGFSFAMVLSSLDSNLIMCLKHLRFLDNITLFYIYSIFQLLCIKV